MCSLCIFFFFYMALLLVYHNLNALGPLHLSAESI